jgi:uncharacterized protein YkwD
MNIFYDIFSFIAYNVVRFSLLLALSGFILLLFYIFKWRKSRRTVSFKGKLLSQVNRARQKHGIGKLGRTKLLDNVARKHSKSMAKWGTCDHDGFTNRASYIESKTGLSDIAENCYKFPSHKYDWYVAKKLVYGWLESPGHRVNLLNPKFKRTGIGIIVKRGYVYATQIFTN